MRRLLSASVFLALLAVSSPASAMRVPPAATLPVASPDAKVPGVTYAVEVIDVAKLMKKYKIVQPLPDLKAVTSDAKGEHVAFVFVDKNDVASVYKDGKLMMQAIIQVEPDTGVFPLVFRFTPDGKLLHAVNPYDLYLDARHLSSARNGYSYYAAAESAVYAGGIVTFAEDHSIREYRSAPDKVTVRYEHPGERIVMLRRSGKDIVYTAKDEDGVSRIYKNGKLLSDEPVDNPANFLLLKDGSVAFFTADGKGQYSVIRNGKRVFTGKGLSAFLFEDPKGGLWNVGYTVLENGDLDVKVFRGEEMLATNLGNMEGMVSFLAQRSFAFRGSPFGGDGTFYLYKDGKKTGEGFSFDGQRDATGIRYAENGKTYMRNLLAGHWAVYEDGKRLLPAKIRDAWYVNIAGRSIQVFATTR